MLRGLRSLFSFNFGEFPEDVCIRVIHASFRDFLHDPERSKDYHVDYEELMHTGFCDAFSLGCDTLRLDISTDGGIESALWHPKGLSVTVMILEKQPMYLPVGDTDLAWFIKIERLSGFIRQCLNRSSRKDQLIQVVRESIATGVWYPCLQGLDNWSDWERFAALELLIAAVGFWDDVHCHSYLVPKFTELRHWFHRLQTQLSQPRILLCG